MILVGCRGHMCAEEAAVTIPSVVMIQYSLPRGDVALGQIGTPVGSGSIGIVEQEEAGIRGTSQSPIARPGSLLQGQFLSVRSYRITLGQAGQHTCKGHARLGPERA